MCAYPSSTVQATCDPPMDTLSFMRSSVDIRRSASPSRSLSGVRVRFALAEAVELCPSSTTTTCSGSESRRFPFLEGQAIWVVGSGSASALVAGKGMLRRGRSSRAR